MSDHIKSDKEWKKLLDHESYRVTRQSGTERPFSGKYWNFNKDGIYKCVCCCLLYTSDAADEQRGVDLGGRRIIKNVSKMCITV